MSHAAFDDRMPRVIAARRALSGLIVLLASCAPARLPPGPASAPSTVCRACFWDHQPGPLRTELIATYRDRRFDDPLLEAERRMLLAAVTDDRAAKPLKPIFDTFGYVRGTDFPDELVIIGGHRDG